MQGVHSYCLTLDPQADRYVARIFGENNYSIVDQVEKPPRAPADGVCGLDRLGVAGGRRVGGR